MHEKLCLKYNVSLCASWFLAKEIDTKNSVKGLPHPWIFTEVWVVCVSCSLHY